MTLNYIMEVANCAMGGRKRCHFASKCDTDTVAIHVEGGMLPDEERRMRAMLPGCLTVHIVDSQPEF